MPILNIVVKKTVIPNSAIFSRKACPSHDDVSPESIDNIHLML